MGFIRLTKIYSKKLELSEFDSKRFKERYDEALKKGDQTQVIDVIKEFYESWIPYSKESKIEMLINSDCIEFCEELKASSELLIHWKHEEFLPRVTKVFLKGHNESFLVLESAYEIEKSIEKAAKNNA